MAVIFHEQSLQGRGRLRRLLEIEFDQDQVADAEMQMEESEFV